jgi:hypothetical protein
MSSPKTQLPFPDHQLIEHLQKEVDRLSNLLELANIRIVHLEQEKVVHLAALGGMGPDGEAGFTGVSG